MPKRHRTDLFSARARHAGAAASSAAANRPGKLKDGTQGMRLTGLRAWRIALPLKEGRYVFASGHAVETLDTTLVELSTDDGRQGYGECCPLGSAYLAAWAGGVRAGLAELAPHLLGLDPRELDIVNAAMDRGLKGHPYVKSAIDMACWDLLGKATSMPVVQLLGGATMQAVPLYRAITQLPPEQMAANVAGYRAQGYRRFQLKVGGDADADIARIHAVAASLEPGEVLVADANTGWNLMQATRVVHAVAGLDVRIEQPCATYEQCLQIRARTSLPMILDEVITDTNALLRMIADGAADGVNLKLSRLGGLTRLRQARDICVAAGLSMTIEDSWGGDVTTAAIAHAAQSTPAALYLSATDFNSYTTRSFADGAPRRDNGTMKAATAPGLGVQPRLHELGQPFLEIA